MEDFTAELINHETIFCQWKRPIVTTVKGVTFDLDKPHYILTAVGHFSTFGVFGNIGKHEQYKYLYEKKNLKTASELKMVTSSPKVTYNLMPFYSL